MFCLELSIQLSARAFEIYENSQQYKYIDGT